MGPLGGLLEEYGSLQRTLQARVTGVALAQGSASPALRGIQRLALSPSEGPPFPPLLLGPCNDWRVEAPSTWNAIGGI